MNVRNLFRQFDCDWNEGFISLEREEPRERGEDDRVFRDPKRLAQFRIGLRGQKRFQFHAAVDDFVLFGLSDSRGKALVDHCLRDGVNPFSAGRRGALAGNVDEILPELFVAVKGETVDRVRDERHMRRFRRETSDDSRFGAVRVHHVIFFLAEQFFQEGVSLQVGERRDCADQMRTLHDFESGTRYSFEQFAFRTG